MIVDDQKFNCDIIEGFLMVLELENYADRITFANNGL